MAKNRCHEGRVKGGGEVVPVNPAALDGPGSQGRGPAPGPRRVITVIMVTIIIIIIVIVVILVVIMIVIIIIIMMIIIVI